MHRLIPLGVVVIARNEGERLRACLESLRSVESGKCAVESAAGEVGSRKWKVESAAAHDVPASPCPRVSASPDPEVSAPALSPSRSLALPLVYVDSGSTDGSVELARSMGADVVELDMGRPFSAARARNEGFARLRENLPDAECVQFVDGDCVVAEGWISAAATFLNENRGYAAVAGRLRERCPEKSIYNRLCDMEWNTPVGNIDACGGIAMYRADAFEQAGRFDETVVAGEEPELCLRLRRAGWKIRRLGTEMAHHDAAMTRLQQWWWRSARGGYGGTDVAMRFEKGDGEFSRQVRSARLWAVGWPLGVLVITGAAWALAGWRVAVLAAGLTLATLPMQMARVAAKGFRRCGDLRTALAYGLLTMLGKWAHLQGQYRYWRDRRAGRHLSLIEYKGPDDEGAVAHV